MYDEMREPERPSLRIEQPPAWWIEQRKREMEEEKEEENESRIIIIDIGSGEERPSKDENGVVIINL